MSLNWAHLAYHAGSRLCCSSEGAGFCQLKKQLHFKAISVLMEIAPLLDPAALAEHRSPGVEAPSGCSLRGLACVDLWGGPWLAAAPAW